MSSQLKKMPKIRLADPGSPGGEVFNFYQIMSLASSLYLKVSDREDVEAFRVHWNVISDNMIQQIGLTYDMWQRTVKSHYETLPVPADLMVLRRTEILVKRLVLLEENLNVWTTVQQWARVLLLVEIKIAHLGSKIASTYPCIEIDMLRAKEGSEIRSSALKAVARLAQEWDDALSQQFAIPQAL